MEQLAIQLLGNSPHLIVSLLLWAEIRAMKIELQDHKQYCHDFRKGLEYVRKN